MMCYSYRVGAEHVEAVRRHVGCEIDLRRFDYFVSGWSGPGFRTPGGLYPPPKDLPPGFGDARRVRSVTPAESTDPPTLHLSPLHQPVRQLGMNADVGEGDPAADEALLPLMTSAIVA